MIEKSEERSRKQHRTRGKGEDDDSLGGSGPLPPSPVTCDSPRTAGPEASCASEYHMLSLPSALALAMWVFKNMLSVPGCILMPLLQTFVNVSTLLQNLPPQVQIYQQLSSLKLKQFSCTLDTCVLYYSGTLGKSSKVIVHHINIQQALKNVSKGGDEFQEPIPFPRHL